MSTEQEHLRENAVLLGDVTKYFRNHKRFLITIATVAGLCCALLSLLMPIKYQVLGTFKDGEKGGGGIAGSSSAINMLLQGPKAQNSFAALMKSRALLRRVIAKSGVQVSEELLPLPLRVIKRIRRNLSASYNEKIAFPDSFRFANVSHSRMTSSPFLCKALSDTQFLIRTEAGTEVTGTLGQPCTFDETTLTVKHFPRTRKKKWIKHVVQPAELLISDLQKGLEIAACKQDMSIIEIVLWDGIPLRAEAVVNAVMDTYKEHLVNESNRVTSEHLDSLYEHKGLVQDRIEVDFKNYAAVMKKNVDEVGFLDDKTELQYLYGQEKEIALAIRKIDQTLFAIAHETPLSGNGFDYRNSLIEREEKIRMTQSLLDFDSTQHLQQDVLQVSRRIHRDPLLRSYLRHTYEKSGGDLHGEIIPRFLNKIAGSELFSRQGAEKHDLFSTTPLIANEEVLQQHAQQLLAKIQEIRTQQESLKAACHSLKTTLYDIHSLKVLVAELALPPLLDFDTLLVKAEDRANHTEKERKLFEERLHFFKRMFGQMMAEKISMLSEKKRLLQADLASVKQAMSFQLTKQLASAQSYRRQLEQQTRRQLHKERTLLQQRLKKIKERLKHIPDKWAMNTKLHMSSEVDKNIMTHLLQFIESKNLQNKLSTIEARPLDEAYFSPAFKKSSPLVFAIAGAGVGGFLGASGLLLIGLLYGFPISGPNAAFKGYTYHGVLTPAIAGPLSGLSECDRECLRGITAEAQGSVTALVHGHGPLYAPYVAELLGRQGHKVLLVDITQPIAFETPLPGLYEFATSPKTPLQTIQCGTYEKLSLGKGTEFLAEFLRSHQFHVALTHLVSTYDKLLLVTQAPLSSDEVLATVLYSEHGVLSFQKEVWEEVTRLRAAAKTQGISLSFLEY